MRRDAEDLGSLSPDSPGELDVLWHDGHTLGVDGAQVGVFEQADQVSLAGLLQRANGSALEPEIQWKCWIFWTQLKIGANNNIFFLFVFSFHEFFPTVFFLRQG